MASDDWTGRIAEFESAWRGSQARGEALSRHPGAPAPLEALCRSLPPASAAAVRRVMADLGCDIERFAPRVGVPRGGRGRPGGAGVPLSPADFAYRTLGR